MTNAVVVIGMHTIYRQTCCIPQVSRLLFVVTSDIVVYFIIIGNLRHASHARELFDMFPFEKFLSQKDP